MGVSTGTGQPFLTEKRKASKFKLKLTEKRKASKFKACNAPVRDMMAIGPVVADLSEWTCVYVHNWTST